MEVSRESLVQNLTGLKSLLRLNTDGIGDDEDLAAQLSQTRLALDKFESDLLGNQNIIREDVITPDTLPPSSRASAIADEDLDREDGITYFSRPTTASSMTSQRFSLDSLPQTWRSPRNSLPFVSPRDSLARKFGFVEDVKEVPEMTEAEEEEEEEEAGKNDVTFQRLSMLLAGLQAQAEAAVGSPTGPSRQPSTLESSVEVEEEITFSGMSRSTSSSIATVTNNVKGFNASCPGTPRLTASFHRPSSSVPFIAPRPSRRSSRIIIDKDGDLFNIPPSPRVPPSPIKQVSTASQPLKFELPPTPPPTLRKRPVGLDLSPPKPGISSTLPSPAALSRRSSYLVTDTELETLLSDFLEQTQIRNLEGAYDVMFTWVWACLLGSGVVWAAVGWILGWGCRECSCVAAS